MPIGADYLSIKSEMDAAGVTLVAVSKTHPPETILQVYHLSQRIFGENRAQELLEKQALLPADIQWHLIGHLQTNKVRLIVPHVSMVASVDSIKLLKLLDKEASAINKELDILLQIKIAEEETKYGFDPKSVEEQLITGDYSTLTSLRVRGVMGMASFVDDEVQLRKEFRSLKDLFETLKRNVFADNPDFDQISMGMSGDYQIAIQEGSTMVRIGSLIFGERKTGPI